jgi:hypothetical protein
MNLLNYWKFFSANKFPRDSKFTFFEDGSFAVYCYQKVTLYNAECEVRKTLVADNVLVLSNGIIATVSKNSNRLTTFHNGFAVISLDIENFRTVTAAENALHVTFNDGTDKLLFVDKDGQIQKVTSLGLPTYFLVDMSANGRILILNSYSFREQSVKILMDFKDITPKGCFRAEFLEDKKHYICNMNTSDTAKRCTLNDSEGREVYASNISFSITPLGECIALDNKVVAKPSMDIIGEAKNLQAVYWSRRDCYCISPNVIRFGNLYGYWIASQGMQLLLNTKECKMIGYFYEGRLYVMDLLDQSIHAQAVLFTEDDNSTAWTSYRNIVNSMIPKTRVL